jgi:hypothetical protein
MTFCNPGELAAVSERHRTTHLLLVDEACSEATFPVYSWGIFLIYTLRNLENSQEVLRFEIRAASAGYDKPALWAFRLQNNPIVLPSASTSIISAAGTLGNPGIVMISPV